MNIKNSIKDCIINRKHINNIQNNFAKNICGVLNNKGNTSRSSNTNSIIEDNNKDNRCSRYYKYYKYYKFYRYVKHGNIIHKSGSY